MAIADSLTDVKARIAAAERRFLRPAGDVKLLAVSKRKTVAAIEEAILAGQRWFGENQLQEALPKIETIGRSDLEWHYIGPIQSNKTRPIATNFDWVHGVDRLKIAARLSEHRPHSLEPLQVCIQVNVSGEDSKSGVTVDDVDELAHAVSELPNLQLRGLMAIPQPEPDFEAQRQSFAVLRAKFDRLNQSGLAMDTLSMGMTDDMEAAIAEGATIVRIGTAIFGTRDT
jgi:pyridoxal phosphate enzyme (YggS family)